MARPEQTQDRIKEQTEDKTNRVGLEKSDAEREAGEAGGQAA